MERIELNGVPVSGGLAAVDTFVGATDCDPARPAYGGAHVIEELVAGRSVTLEAWGKGTDDYPRRHIRSHVTLDDINEAILYNPRNCYQNYNAATNSSERMLHTYMGTLLPKLRNVSYSTAGELSPLLNDPTCRTIGMGTRIFLCGARGYVSWQGTQFNTSKPVNEHGIPIGGARTVAAIGNLREMSTDYLRAAYYEKYGVRRYGFHGTSHRYVSARLAELMGKDIKDLKIITCHLGNGSSITAVDGGKSVDTRSEERRVGKECRSRWSPYH